LSNRKQIRDWFKQALLPHSKVLGTVYPYRSVELDPDSPTPKFTNIYISEGESRQAEQGLGVMTYMQAEVGFHLKAGKDDDLDQMEDIADTALEEYMRLYPATFDFYKERFNYSGDSEDAYISLFITFQIISR